MSTKRRSIARPEDFEPATLMRARVENIKAVKYIDLTFDQPVTVIGGDNSQGKSSFLDGIEWAVEGKTAMQDDPIREGEQSGTVQVDFGDGQNVTLSVRRTLTRVGNGPKFIVETEIDIPGFIAPTRVEEFLRSIGGGMGVDPLEFDRMKDEERFEFVRGLITGFDFEANAAERKHLFDERTGVNRDLKREQAAADAINVSDKPPCEEIDEAALSKRLAEAASIEERRTRRQNAAQRIAELRQAAAKAPEEIERMRADIVAMRDRDIARLEEQIAALQRQIKEARKRCDDEIAQETNRLNEKAEQATKEADELQARLDKAEREEPLPEKTDPKEIEAQLARARESNQKRREWKTLYDKKQAHRKEAERLATESDRLTRAIEDLDKAREDAIRSAKLPVEGLGIGDRMITLNGKPWAQAGEAERTAACCAIAMALNPKLRTILIRHGSGVGKQRLALIEQWARERGYRVIMEIYDDIGSRSSVVIENGMVKQREAAA